MKRLKLHSGITIVEVRDPMIITEMENDNNIKPYLGDRLSDTCIVVHPQAVREVMQRLRVLGHMPRLLNGHNGNNRASE